MNSWIKEWIKDILGKAQVYKCTKERLRKAQCSKHKPVKSRHLLQASGAYYPVIGKHKITLRNPMERNEWFKLNGVDCHESSDKGRLI